MNIYFSIGSFLGLIVGCVWLFTFAVVLWEKTNAYIHNRLAIKSAYLRFMVKAEASMYSYDRIKYERAELDPKLALTGEHVAGVFFIGLLFTVCTLLLWPITMIILTLKGLRAYNTNPVFADIVDRLFSRQEKKLHGLNNLNEK